MIKENVFRPTLTVGEIVYCPQPPDRNANQTLIAIIEKDKFLWRVGGRLSTWTLCDEAGKSIRRFRFKKMALKPFREDDIEVLETNWSHNAI